MKSNVAQTMVEIMAFATNKVNPIIINPLTSIWNSE
jgi:hypothetical protein